MSVRLTPPLLPMLSAPLPVFPDDAGKNLIMAGEEHAIKTAPGQGRTELV